MPDAGVLLHTPFVEIASVNSPKSCEADVFRVLSYLTADQVLSPPLVSETVDFRILMSNLVPFASIDIIRALDHLHAGIA